MLKGKSFRQMVMNATSLIKKYLTWSTQREKLVIESLIESNSTENCRKLLHVSWIPHLWWPETKLLDLLDGSTKINSLFSGIQLWCIKGKTTLYKLFTSLSKFNSTMSKSRLDISLLHRSFYYFHTERSYLPLIFQNLFYQCRKSGSDKYCFMNIGSSETF